MFELAIYGGTFAPVHNGHIHAARAFFDAVKPDKLLIIPTLIPPHKQIDFIDSPNDRFEMLKLAFKDEPLYGDKIFISDIELNSPAPSYTVNTLRALSAPDTRITMLVGTDMFLTLDRWFMSEEIFRLCRVALMQRENDKTEIKAQIDKKLTIYRNKCNADVIIINEPPIEISSSDIRGFSDEMRKKYLPKPVYDFVKERGLYADK